ncbi:MAG: hypothetical protein HY784_09505 [Chloroflexi bacterium]|nr:hypothetical protein [Chloroflexota bacterium]
MADLVISAELASQVYQIAEEQGLEVNAFVENAIQTALRRARDRSIIARTRDWYDQTPAMRLQFAGLYVAWHQGQVVDADPDRLALYMRVRGKYGSLPVAIVCGGDVDRPEIRLPSPRLDAEKP